MAKRIVVNVEKGLRILDSSKKGEKEEASSPLLVEEKEDQFRAILDNIPTVRGKRKRAEKLLKIIWPYIRLTEDNELLYDDDSTGSVAMDLLLYVITDPEAERVSTSQQPPPKPTDLKRFVKILKMAGVKRKTLLYLNKRNEEGKEEEEEDETDSEITKNDSVLTRINKSVAGIKKGGKKPHQAWQSLYRS